MVKFKGFRLANNDCVVLVSTGGDVWANLPLYLDEFYSSPTGFEWGYFGAGPTQLAYAMLRFLAEGLEYNQDDLEQLARDFKWHVVGSFKREGWEYEVEGFQPVLDYINFLREIE